MNVVYDIMVFIQAASRPDRAHATFQAIFDGRVTLCLSEALLIELRDVLNRDSVRAKFPALTRTAVEVFIADVMERGVLFDPVPSVFSWPHHPDDDHLFNLAIAAEAKYLVTWETRILKLGKDVTPSAVQLRQLAPELSISTPAELAAELKRQGEQPRTTKSPSGPGDEERAGGAGY